MIPTTSADGGSSLVLEQSERAGNKSNIAHVQTCMKEKEFEAEHRTQATERERERERSRNI